MDGTVIELQQDDGPVMSGTMLHATEDISRFFEEYEDRLPVFLGQSLAEHAGAWVALNRKDRWLQWRRAAIAASLDRVPGRRIPSAFSRISGEEPTKIEEFCRAQRIGLEYLSRLSRTYRTFNQPLDPGIKELLADPFFSFKHFLIAATIADNSGVTPTAALQQARKHKWSANELARWLTANRNILLIDDEAKPLDPAKDDDDVQFHWRQVRSMSKKAEPLQSPAGTFPLSWLLTRQQSAPFYRQLRDLRAVFGTTSDKDTMLAAIARAAAEWVESRAAEEVA
jgi:hypothetical protein